MKDERRRSVRIKKALEIIYSSSSPPIHARLEDLSETGMFVETSHPLEQGAMIEFTLVLPDENMSTPVKGKGEVSWTDQVGAGVRFTSISDEDRERIKWYVAEVFFG
ncbi:MAG: PilZ domain-containing protein [Thermoanaerobaculia bacterium]